MLILHISIVLKVNIQFKSIVILCKMFKFCSYELRFRLFSAGVTAVDPLSSRYIQDISRIRYVTETPQGVPRRTPTEDG